jgi:hypothetical protein
MPFEPPRRHMLANEISQLLSKKFDSQLNIFNIGSLAVVSVEQYDHNKNDVE